MATHELGGAGTHGDAHAVEGVGFSNGCDDTTCPRCAWLSPHSVRCAHCVCRQVVNPQARLLQDAITGPVRLEGVASRELLVLHLLSDALLCEDQTPYT